MRKLMLVAVVLLVALALGASETQAASCATSRGSAIWKLNVTPGYWYTVSATSSHLITLTVYEHCWREGLTVYCRGRVGRSGPGFYVSVDLYATEYVYWAVVLGGPHRLCLS